MFPKPRLSFKNAGFGAIRIRLLDDTKVVSKPKLPEDFIVGVGRSEEDDSSRR